MYSILYHNIPHLNRGASYQPDDQTPERIPKVDPQFWSLVLLWCRLQKPRVDLQL